MKPLIKWIFFLSSLIALFNCSRNSSPEIPSSPSEPNTGKINQNLTFSSFSTDLNGDDVSYQFNWGDDNLSQWSDFIESGETITATHTWNDSGLVGTTYTFHASTTDPDGDSISYQFDWGDGNLSYWTDLVPSGNIASSEHKWEEQGIYSIRVLARDKNNEESSWSNHYPVNIIEGGGSSSYPNRVLTTIPVGYRPQHIGILPNDEYVYVPNRESNSVSVISTSSNTVVATIPVGSEPNGATALPNGEYVYLTLFGYSGVMVIRTSDNTVVDSIPEIPNPHTSAALPNGEYLYVSSRAIRNVYVIRTSDNTIVDSIAVTSSDSPVEIVAFPNGEYVYVGTGEGNVSVIRTSDNTNIATIPIAINVWAFYLEALPNGEVDDITVDSDPRGIASLPSSLYVYVANRSDGTISVINTSTNEVLDVITVGSGPMNLSSLLNGEYIYVTNAWGNTVSVIGY